MEIRQFLWLFRERGKYFPIVYRLATIIIFHIFQQSELHWSKYNSTSIFLVKVCFGRIIDRQLTYLINNFPRPIQQLGTHVPKKIRRRFFIRKPLYEINIRLVRMGRIVTFSHLKIGRVDLLGKRGPSWFTDYQPVPHRTSRNKTIMSSHILLVFYSEK